LQTLVVNNNGIPVKELEKKKILCITAGTNNPEVFFKHLNRYVKVDTVAIFNATLISNYELDELVAPYTLIIWGQFGLNESPRNRFGWSTNEIDLLTHLIKRKSVILNWFGNPYGLKYLTDLELLHSIIVSYSDSPLDQKMAAEAIFGGIPVVGKLPVSINKRTGFGTNPIIHEQIRLNYSEPAIFNLPDTAFKKIDSLAQFAIDTGATPGCRIIYAKHGSVIYDKCFGYQTYKKEPKVSADAVYDLASLTKIASTTLALIKLYDNGTFEPSTKLATYFPELAETDKENITIAQVLAHHAGLKSWIPFYKNSLDSLGNLDPIWYNKTASNNYSVKVADGIYLNQQFQDSVFKSIIDTPVYHKNKYRYSDLGFYWLAAFVQKLSGDSIHHFVNNQFYSKLGMTHTTYFPLKHRTPSEIIPTENDKLFRKQIIRGYVHDQGAALFGGIAGHAGLFSTANDMAILGQMLLNEGSYGGEVFFTSKSFDVFNKQYFKRKRNRRALGFDKPALKQHEDGPTCISASQQSFGHSGFTGTYLWVDPVNQSVFVFLSNRTFPDAENKLLLDLNIRTQIQQAFYDVFQH